MASTTTIKAAQFPMRKDLDAYVLNNFGDDLTTNRASGQTISATAADMKRLHVDQSVTIYGVPVILLQG